MYYNYDYPNPKYQIIGHLDPKPQTLNPKPYISLYTPIDPFKGDLIIGYMDPVGMCFLFSPSFPSAKVQNYGLGFRV